jgi:benzaldehyde dehydrogenase (NAD)
VSEPSSLLAGAAWTEGAYLDGGWRAGGGEPVDVVEPATGAVIGTFAAATPELVGEACARAAVAAPGWIALGAEERGRILLAAAEHLAAGAEEVAGWLVREGGATRGKVAVEIDGALAELRFAAAQAQRSQDRVLSEPGAPTLSLARRVPLGVVGAITPWNMPLLLAMRTVAPALALGNAVVLKPDPQTPVGGGALLAAAFERAGLPSGVLAVLLGGAETGEALVTDPGSTMISFTGSSAVGRRIGELAGGRLKKLALELGGNSPFIVLEDTDLDLASAAGASSSFQHQGQICMAGSRHIVHESVAEEYVARLVARAERLRVGDPGADPGVDLGPLINPRQLEKVDRIVNASVAAGAELRCGGDHVDLFYRPTVLSGVEPSMPAFAEEIFGPVAPVTTFADDAEAAALAGRTEYGLAAAVHSRSAERARELGDRLPVGMVHVNGQTVNDLPQAPFGGRGASGNGSRFGGDANWEAFTQWQWLTVTEEPGGFPF